MPREYVVDLLVGRVGQPDALEQRVDAVLGHVRVHAVEPARVAQVLAAGHAAVEADGVGQVADVALDLERACARIDAQHARRAAGRLGQAEQHQDRRRLARAVGPEQAEDLALVDRQVELVDRRELAVLLGQAARMDGNRRRRRTACGSAAVAAGRLSDGHIARKTKNRPTTRPGR